jgi:hypothetical protein
MWNYWASFLALHLSSVQFCEWFECAVWAAAPVMEDFLRYIFFNSLSIFFTFQTELIVTLTNFIKRKQTPIARAGGSTKGEDLKSKLNCYKSDIMIMDACNKPPAGMGWVWKVWKVWKWKLRGS